MILTNTRFLRRPSRPTGQPFRLASRDPLAGAKVETAAGHRNHHLAAHDFPFQVRIGIPVTPSRTGVLAGAVVPSVPRTDYLQAGLVDRCVWSQFFEPRLAIMVQAALAVVYQKNTIAARQPDCPSRLEVG